MAEPTQYTFNLEEITTALIKMQDLHEGKWLLGFEMNMSAGMFGPSPSDAKPGAMFQILGLNIARAPEPVPPGTPFVVDASKVNPRNGKLGSRTGRKPASG